MNTEHFRPTQFLYDEDSDTIRCPGGHTLRPSGKHTRNRAIRYRTSACKTCALKPLCTPGAQRTIHRLLDQGALDRMEARIYADPSLMRIRRCTVEHPFGTIKRMSGGGRFLTRGLRRVKAEAALSVLAFNIIRPNWFMQNFHTFWLPGIQATGNILLPVGKWTLAAFLGIGLAQVYGPVPAGHRIENVASINPIPTSGEGRMVEFAGGRKSYDVSKNPRLGPADAKHVMVEYFDYQCAYCKTIAPVIAKLAKEAAPSERADLYRRDLRDVETRLAFEQAEHIACALRHAQAVLADQVLADVQRGLAGALHVQHGGVLAREIGGEGRSGGVSFVTGTLHAALDGGEFVDQHVIGHGRSLPARFVRAMVRARRPA